MPSASIAEAMVLAVYMPPQAPAPGRDCCDDLWRFGSSMRPAMYSPYDWKALTMSSFALLAAAGADRAAVDHDRGAVQARHRHEATRHVLVAAGDGDQFASYHWAPMTVSIESAMISRDWSE
jgi:hypothetical protein